MTPSTITRRHALGILAASPVAIAAPVAAAPDPLELARHHYAEFARAMDLVAADAEGWMISGRRGFVHLHTIHHEADPQPGCPSFVAERHRQIEGFGRGVEKLRAS